MHRSALLGIGLFLAMVVLLIPVLAGPAKSGTTAVHLAAIAATSGMASVHNQASLRGLHLAAAKINSRGGCLGSPLELTVLDNQSTSLGSRRAAQEAVRLGVAAVLGPIWSSHSLAAAPVLQAAGIPMVTPLSTNTRVTEVGDHIFRTCFTDDFQGRVMARFARERLNAATCAVLASADEDYSQGLAKVFAKEFLAAGGKVVYTADYRAKSLDFTPQLAQVQRLDPNVIFVPGYGLDVGLIIRQARSLGITTVFLGGDAWSDLYDHDIQGLEGNYYSTFWHPDLPVSGNASVRRDFLEASGQHVRDSMDTAMAYDALLLVVDAIERAGSTQPALIRQALADTSSFVGVTGSIAFDASRNPVGRGAVILKTGEQRPSFETVYDLQSEISLRQP